MSLLLSIIYLLFGIGVLALGAYYFMLSSCEIGKRLKMPSLAIGVLIVGFGGSFPEIIVSLIASLHHQSSLAVGNAIGSNIVNLGMVLGISSLVMPLVVDKQSIKRDFPLLWVVMILVGVMLWLDHDLSPENGVLLLLGLVAYLLVMLRSIAIRKRASGISRVQLHSKQASDSALKIAIIWLLGLLGLFGGSELIVKGATDIARYLGMNEIIIGLTVVAIGTSLPEFATTMISALRKEFDVALGNVLGSNIFNLLAVLAMPALFSPVHIGKSVMTHDYMVMMVMTLVAMLGAMFPRGEKTIGRPTACLLIVMWIAYYIWLFQATGHHG